MKFIKRFITLILMVVMFGAGAVVADYFNINYIGDPKVDVTTEEFKAKLKEVSELAALDYEYDGKFKYDGGSITLLGKDIPFTNKSMMVHYKGVIKLGTNMEKADVELNSAGNKIIITVPHSKILSHEIKENTYKIIDVKNGVFNRVKVEDDVEFRKLQKKKVEKNLKQSVYETADENLKKQLISFFSFGYPEMKIEVVYK